MEIPCNGKPKEMISRLLKKERGHMPVDIDTQRDFLLADNDPWLVTAGASTATADDLSGRTEQ